MISIYHDNAMTIFSSQKFLPASELGSGEESITIDERRYG